MIYNGLTDQAAGAANTAVYAMSLAIEESAKHATAAEAATATYLLAAALDSIALTLGRISNGQIAATSDETVAMAQAAAHVHKSAETAREAAAMALNRHETTED